VRSYLNNKSEWIDTDIHFKVSKCYHMTYNFHLQPKNSIHCYKNCVILKGTQYEIFQIVFICIAYIIFHKHYPREVDHYFFELSLKILNKQYKN